MLAPVAASMVLEAAARGMAPGPLLARLGLDETTAHDPERRVPFAALFDVWGACMRELRDPGLPIAAAQRIPLQQYTVLAFATMTAPTFGAALSILVRYGGVVADGAGWRLEDEPGRPAVRLRWERAGERTLGHRVANECAIAEALHVARQILGTRLVPPAVAFQHAAPGALAAHEAFFGVRPTFGAAWDGLELARDVLDHVPRQANPALAAWLEQQMAVTLAARATKTLAEQVQQLVEQDLAGGAPNLARVARALGCSDRTLRRQLEKDGASFRGLWEEARRRRAELLLAAGRVSIDEVAFLTGFSETSAFARAFKRWNGQTPGEYRRDRLGQANDRAGQ